MKLTTTWDLSALGKGVKDPDFLKERTVVLRTAKAFEKKWRGTSSFLKHPKTLRTALDEYAKLSLVGEREPRYLHLSSALDTGNTSLQAAIVRYRDFGNQVADHIRFFELALGTIPETTQSKLLADKELNLYRNYLLGVFRSAKHFLGEQEEKILSMKSSVASGNWVDMLDEFLSAESREVLVRDSATNKIVKKILPFASIMSLLKEQNPKVSKSAEVAVIDILSSNAKVAEKEINSFLENKKINDELRGYPRPDSARHDGEDIDTKAVDTLIEVVSNNFKVSRDFYTFKAQLMKRDGFNYWNRNVEYGASSSFYTYDEAVSLVERAFRRIDDSFASTFLSFAQHGQIDVYPKKGKTGGAFCSGSYRYPTVLMLNYTGSLRDVTTLAHEMGHGMHAEMARIENPLNYEPPMCTAEVASTFCEDFVLDELERSASEEERLVIMVGQLEDKVATIFRQVAAYNFEFELHQRFRNDGYLPNEVIGKLFNKHMKSYMGSSVSLDEHSGLGWVYWSHFRSPFYVYSYAMALLVSQFARKRFKGDPSFIDSIKQFYQTGSSISPREIYARLGLDVDDPGSWQEGIDEVKELLRETKKLAKKLGKI